jgi:hypothetical protein
MTTEDILNAPYIETLLLLIAIGVCLLLVTRLVELSDRRTHHQDSMRQEEDDLKLIEDIIKNKK